MIELGALLKIGDGVFGFFKPRWHSLLWDVGPAPFRNLMEELAVHPDNARLLYAIKVGVGTWLANRQTPEKSSLI
jgi:hypothetical protein